MNAASIARGALAVALGFLIAASAAAAPGGFKFTEADAGAIIGEVQKPDVTVFISRENLNKAYDLQLSESFLDRIVGAVDSAPF